MAKFLSIFLKFLVTLPVVAFLFFVTLENRDGSVSLVWSPLNEAAHVSVPVVVFSGLVLGFIWGSLILWSNTLPMRADRRRLKKQVAQLENQIEIQKNEYERSLKMASAPKHTFEPVPPPARVAIPEIL